MRRLFVLPLLLPLAAGCGGPYKTARVSGRVTLNGKPLANAAVLFQPVATQGNNEPGPGSAGTTGPDGRYTLSLVGKGGKGAVVGKHTVRIIPMAEGSDSADDRPEPVTRPGARRDRTKPLTFEVPPGGTDAANFDITSP